MATLAILDKLQKIPTKTRAVVFFAIIGIAVVLFIWQVHIPKTNEIRRLEGEIAEHKAKIAENAA